MINKDKHSHNITLDESRRMIIMCGVERIEMFCNSRFVEFCPLCGDKIK